MVCFDGGTFGLAAFEVCTEREVTCDGECAATLTLGTLTLLMALYDAYNISHHLKHLVASRRHMVSMMVTLGLYASMNALSALFTEERLMWGGISSFLRIYFVYSYMLWTMSILFVEGWGDFEELIERTGRLLEESHGKNAAWVRRCVLKVQLWMAETVSAQLHAPPTAWRARTCRHSVRARAFSRLRNFCGRSCEPPPSPRARRSRSLSQSCC